MRLPNHGEKLWTDAADYQANPIYSSAPVDLKSHADSFHRYGYTVVDNSLEEREVDNAVEAYRQWLTNNHGRYHAQRELDGKPPRIIDFHSECAEVAELFTRNRSLRVQDFLFNGHETSIYTSLFFENSTQQPIHRDAPVFRTSPENWYFGMWVALEDATKKNGALIVYPGGHRAEIDEYAIADSIYNDVFDAPEQNPTAWNAYQRAVSDECRAMDLRLTQVELKKGQTLIWHPLLPHGGGEIVDPGSTRLSIVFHTVPFGMAVYRQDVFFNRFARKVSRYSNFEYKMLPSDRKFADFGGVKFQSL